MKSNTEESAFAAWEADTRRRVMRRFRNPPPFGAGVPGAAQMQKVLAAARASGTNHRIRARAVEGLLHHCRAHGPFSGWPSVGSCASPYRQPRLHFRRQGVQLKYSEHGPNDGISLVRFITPLLSSISAIHPFTHMRPHRGFGLDGDI